MSLTCWRTPLVSDWNAERVSLIVLFGLSFGGVIYSAIALRSEAGRARGVVLKRLNDDLLTELGSDDPDEAQQRVPQLRKIIAEITEERRGAFSPLSEDPLLWSLTLPFGGMGGLLLIERSLALFQ